MTVLQSYTGPKPMDTAAARALAKEMLSPDRYAHTECVAKAAKYLAQRYNCDVQRAELAALLHDIAKEQQRGDLLQCLQSSDIMSSAQFAALPSLLHAYAGGEFVEKTLGLDAETANAVRYHTAGRAGMSLLEKVVFLADYISEDRDFRGAEEVRVLAETSLNEACLTALRNGIIHICKMNKPLDLHSIEAYNDFVNLRSADNGK